MMRMDTICHPGLEIGFTQVQYPILENIRSFELCTQIDSGVIDPDLMEISLDIIITAGTVESIVHAVN